MRGWLIGFLVCAASSSVAGAAQTEIRVASAPLVALTAPRADAVLAAGMPALLAWQPHDGFAELHDLDEWEGFLSLDGGATYPLRITPQLDLDLRRVRWRVPSVASDEARLLLHLGGRTEEGERFEIAVALPQRFRIVAEAAPPSLPRWVIGRGQVALPGEPGVVGWVAGSRRGAGLHQVLAVEPWGDLTGYRPFELGEMLAELEPDPLPAPDFFATRRAERVPFPPPPSPALTAVGRHPLRAARSSSSLRA